MPNPYTSLGLTACLLTSTNLIYAKEESVAEHFLAVAEETEEIEEISDFHDAYYEDDLDEDGEESEWDIAIGLGYFVSQSPYVGAQQEAEWLPFFSLSWGPFFFDGDSLGSYLYGQDNWGISASISAGVLNDSDRGGSDSLADMTPLSEVVMADVSYEIEADWGAIQVSIETDVSHQHQGNQMSIAYAYSVYFEQWSLTPLAQVDWFDDKVAAYYYGVSAEDAKGARTQYQPGSGVNYVLGLNAEYDIDDYQTLSFTLMTELYSDEVRQSSIVDQSHSKSASGIYSYSF